MVKYHRVLTPILLISFMIGALRVDHPDKLPLQIDEELKPPLNKTMRVEANLPSPRNTPNTPDLLKAALHDGKIDRDTYLLYLAYSIFKPGALPMEYQSNTALDGTTMLLELQQSLDSILDPIIQSQIEQLLSNTCYLAGDGLTNTYITPHFYIEYETIHAGLTITDYATALETTWIIEVEEYGWADPPVYVENPAPGDRYHVVIDDLNSIYYGLYGYVYNQGLHAGLVGDNPNTDWNDVDSYATCMGLNNNYDPIFFRSPAMESMLATIAHEFNHAIQFGYGALTGGNKPDENFYEGGATWIEDEVFDAANDNQYYLWPAFDQCMGEYGGDPYAYWITFRGLTEQYGVGIADAGEQIMQEFWESISQSATNNMLDALSSSLETHDTSLADAYHDYAIAVKFNKPCDSSYAHPYCFEEGAEYVDKAGPTNEHGHINEIGQSTIGSIQDNYALNWISLPTGTEPISVTLKNTSTGGNLQLSLVCDIGTTLRISHLSETVNPEEQQTLYFYDRIGCIDKIVVVITNVAQTAADPLSCRARNYTLSTGESNLKIQYFLPLVLR